MLLGVWFQFLVFQITIIYLLRQSLPINLSSYFIWACRYVDFKELRGLREFYERVLRTFGSNKEEGKKSHPCNRPRRPIGFWDVEAPTFPVDSRLRDGGKVVSLTRRPSFTPPPPQEDIWYSFLLDTESTPGPQCGWK
jgi:hypothetical protein